LKPGEKEIKKNGCSWLFGGVDEMDANLTNPIVLNPALNVTLNASLYQPTQSGIDWSKVDALGIAQVITAVVLAYLTYLLWRSTSGYAKQVETQTGIMKRNTNIQEEQIAINKTELVQNVSLLRYNKLRDEMDKLVAPLYFASLSINVETGNLGWFGLIAPAKRYYSENKHVSEFLDELKRNIYLSRDEKFSQDIVTLFSMQDEYWKDQSEASRKRYIEHLKKLMPVIKDERYPALKSQIKQIESELVLCNKSFKF
jgi:hypothetical protein